MGGLLAVTIGLVIIVICYVWMTASRASQTRMEEQNRRVAELLEEQNRLLRLLIDKK
jgi:hypothetical protein